jgi:membrane protein
MDMKGAFTGKIKIAAFFLKEKYDLLAEKKYTTIAGTLVFFLIMSLMPLAFWLSLLFGKFQFGVVGVLRISVFDSVKDVIEYISAEAKNATVGASFLLLATTLYSATNLFYQMKKSGEIIYEYKRKTGFKARITAFAVLFIIMAFVMVALSVFALASFLSAWLFSGVVERLVHYLLLLTVSFLLVLILNKYICPYKASIKIFLPGTITTIFAWTVSLFGFAIYLKIGNIDRLYGAISAIIIFLLWLYVLMICFVSGVIINSERVLKKRKYTPYV